MADIGRIPSLRLQCKPCGLPFGDGMVMEAVQLHFQVEHDTDEVKLDLVPVCTCGEAMTHTQSRPSGGRTKDYFACGVCGNTGHVYRDEVKRAASDGL